MATRYTGTSCLCSTLLRTQAAPASVCALCCSSVAVAALAEALPLTRAQLMQVPLTLLILVLLQYSNYAIITASQYYN
jgi:hypothetical protein